MRKKRIGEEKPASASEGAFTAEVTVSSTGTARQATGTGTTSVAHSTTEAITTASARCPSGERPACAGARSTARNVANAPASLSSRISRLGSAALPSTCLRSHDHWRREVANRLDHAEGGQPPSLGVGVGRNIAYRDPDLSEIAPGHYLVRVVLYSGVREHPGLRSLHPDAGEGEGRLDVHVLWVQLGRLPGRARVEADRLRHRIEVHLLLGDCALPCARVLPAGDYD